MNGKCERVSDEALTALEIGTLIDMVYSSIATRSQPAANQHVNANAVKCDV